MTLVVDASVAVEYLLRTELGTDLGERLETSSVFAPDLIDAEVLAVLRREVLRGRIEEPRAALAISDLGAWPIGRISNRLLARPAWRFRENVSAYDALYLAAAEMSGCPVLTADGPLSRAPRLGVMIENVRR